jgi:hypothetical protein
MQAFIVMYPNAVQQKDAKERYEVLLYQERTQHDTEAELKDLISGQEMKKLTGTEYKKDDFEQDIMNKYLNNIDNPNQECSISQIKIDNNYENLNNLDEDTDDDYMPDGF